MIKVCKFAFNRIINFYLHRSFLNTFIFSRILLLYFPCLIYTICQSLNIQQKQASRISSLIVMFCNCCTRMKDKTSILTFAKRYNKNKQYARLIVSLQSVTIVLEQMINPIGVNTYVETRKTV